MTVNHCVWPCLLLFKEKSKERKKKKKLKESTSVCFTSHRYWVCVIYLELSRLIVVEVGPRRQEVEEHLQQVHVLPCHVGDLKDWTNPAEREGVKNECCLLTLLSNICSLLWLWHCTELYCNFHLFAIHCTDVLNILTKLNMQEKRCFSRTVPALGV